MGAFISFLGTWFEFVGAQWLVGEETKDTAWLSNLGAAQLLPSLFLGLVGGVVADRVNRRTLLIVTQFLMMLIALGFTLAVYLRSATPIVLLLLSLAQGVVIAFNAPAWQVLIPRLVPREQLFKAITLQGISFNTARAIGPALGGALMVWQGAELLFAVNAIGYICVMAAVMKTPDAPAPQRPAGSWFDWRSMVRDSVEALRYTLKSPGLRAAFLASAVFGLFATPILRFLPLTVSLVYGLDESVFGIMTGIMGAGAVVGGFAVKKVPGWYPKHHLIPLSVLLGGAWILGFSLEENVYIAGVYMFFVGFFWMWAFNTSMGAMQMLVPDAMRGRVLSVVNTLGIGLMPIGAYLAAVVGKFIAEVVRHTHPAWWTSGLETQSGVAACAIILIVAGLVMITWRTPEVDGLKPGDPGYDRSPGLLRGLTAMSHRPRA
jgi:MFS family permease